MKEQSTSTQANIAGLPMAHTAMRHVGAGRHFRTSHMIPLWRVRSFEAFSLFFSFLFIFILGKSSNYTCYPDPSKKKKKRPNPCVVCNSNPFFLEKDFTLELLVRGANVCFSSSFFLSSLFFLFLISGVVVVVQLGWPGLLHPSFYSRSAYGGHSFLGWSGFSGMLFIPWWV